MFEFIRKTPGAVVTDNVTNFEKWLSIGGGLLLIAKGWKRPGLAGLFNIGVGACAIHRGIRGHCAVKEQLRSHRPALAQRFR